MAVTVISKTETTASDGQFDPEPIVVGILPLAVQTEPIALGTRSPTAGQVHPGQ